VSEPDAIVYCYMYTDVDEYAFVDVITVQHTNEHAVAVTDRYTDALPGGYTSPDAVVDSICLRHGVHLIERHEHSNSYGVAALSQLLQSALVNRVLANVQLF